MAASSAGGSAGNGSVRPTNTVSTFLTHESVDDARSCKNGRASLPSVPTLEDTKIICALEQEEDVTDLFNDDEADVPQGVVAGEGEPQQDGLHEAIPGPPEAPQEDLNSPKLKRNPM